MYHFIFVPLTLSLSTFIVALPAGAGTARRKGRDLTGYDTDDVRAVVTGCAADPHIFDATIRDNLRLAKPSAGDAELAAAADRARLLDWITSLPQGWDTPVGTHGIEGLDQVVPVS